MDFPFRRLAIVNRGEPAMRLIHAVREVNAEHGAGIQTIALYTKPDRRAMFVREADEAYSLGKATFKDSDGERKNAYLNYKALESALKKTRADAVWPGWGFVAEHAAFVDLCDRLGVAFLGPTGEVMRRLGDKITSKQIAEAAGVPVAPWSGGPVEDLAAAHRVSGELGFPLMIKATAGGGGRGIRKIDNPADLDDQFESARSEALKAFGDGTVFLERRVSGARHIEVQIIGDTGGTVWAVGVRDCTVQRRNQKVIEEAPSPALTAEQDREIRDAAQRLGAAVGYHSAGTVEFLYDPRAAQFWFMEVNARLQVEHPVTEVTTGLDLVKMQLLVAAGHRLEGEPPPTRGHAIEVRLNAEDPENNLAPAPGEVAIFRPASGPGVRIDAGVEEDDVIAAQFDSMIAKIIGHAATRPEALARLDRALLETALVVKGGASNKSFLRYLLRTPEVVSGELDVGWLDVALATQDIVVEHGEIALLQAAVDSYLAEEELERTRFASAAARGRPELPEPPPFSMELTLQGNTYECSVRRMGAERYRVTIDGALVPLRVENLGVTERRMELGGVSYQVLSVPEEDSLLITVNGVSHRVRRDLGGEVRASAPAVVVSLDVGPGDYVAAGDRLAVLEAMKMEMAVTAPYSGRVRTVLTAPNTQIGPGTPILVLERDDVDAETLIRDRLGFADVAETAHAAVRHNRCTHHLGELESLVLGYDVDVAAFERLIQAEGLLCEDALGDEDVWEREAEILTTFVDIVSLFRPEPVLEDVVEGTRRSPRDYFFDYLRDPGARGEGLPTTFLERLRSALAHYDIGSLDPTSDLRQALYRIYLAYQRLRRMPGPLLVLLQGWLEADDLESYATEYRKLVERLADETQRRFPAIHEVAAEVRYEAFDAPVVEEARAAAYARVEELLASLNADPGNQDHIAALVAATQPLKTMLSARFATADLPLKRDLLEVMTRRYYRIRDLTDVTAIRAGKFDFVTATYPHEGKTISLIATYASANELARAVAAAGELTRAAPAENDVVVDFYGSAETTPDSTQETSDEMAALLEAADFGRPLRRAVFSIAPADGRGGMGAVAQFTFRPTPDGYQEESAVRGLHPMMGKRLEVWRLANFDLERLPAPEDIYLFHGTGRDNSADERMFALAEVRDLTAVRDDAGRLASLPLLERVFNEACAAMRRVQASLPPRKRLLWNRILLYVWPVLGFEPDEIGSLIQRLAVATEGLGIEKVVVRARVEEWGPAEPREVEFEILNPADTGIAIQLRDPRLAPLETLDTYTQKVVQLRRRGLAYPYELIRMITPPAGQAGGFPRGEFQEYDLDEEQRLVPVSRPPGENTANIVVGEITSFTPKYPTGMRRVLIAGDPSRGMGSLAEPECRRINAALERAREKQVPVEWYAVSAGALISMESGTENMDWIAFVLRRLIEFTQDGGEVNVVVTGINVGAQPYWNAEATMLMHTKGILIMTPESAMVLTGKQALDYSGGVSAEDNLGIGGYEQIMGPNGQAQFFAEDVPAACQILLRHYEHSYVVPGERFPRRAITVDSRDRDIRSHRHGGQFETIGDVFSDATNPGRKHPFEIRRVMEAVIDSDLAPLERWLGMADAEIAVTWDAHIGGIPVALIGFESKPLPRFGVIPADGPGQWTAGTLFPQSSRKIARAINAASGSRPLVVLANLSGFDGSPESLRKWQLEYGAEIGRSVVNFDGPIVFCVVSRYHGGAFVVFSNTLNDHLEVAALEGSHASVIGGAPAAAVVFAREVRRRTEDDDRVVKLRRLFEEAAGSDKARLRSQLNRVTSEVHSEKLGEVADEFDGIHSVYRAQEVGSVDHIISPADLRPYLIEAVERGMDRYLETHG